LVGSGPSPTCGRPSSSRPTRARADAPGCSPIPSSRPWSTASPRWQSVGYWPSRKLPETR